MNTEDDPTDYILTRMREAKALAQLLDKVDIICDKLERIADDILVALDDPTPPAT